MAVTARKVGAPGQGRGRRKEGCSEGGLVVDVAAAFGLPLAALAAVTGGAFAGSFDLGGGELQAGPDLVGLDLGDRPLLTFRGFPAALAEPAGDHDPVAFGEGVGQVLGLAAPHVDLEERGPRQDYEFQRRGVCNLFLVCEPLAGWRDVMVSDRRTRIDWAHCVQDLLDVHYPDAERVVLVQDNLNTHTPASLYEAFAPAEARRLADRLELHYTPKHGSWLNMAEIELAVLAGQCLDRRLADQATLEREVLAWQAARNRAGRGVNWRFTTEDARTKLKHLYPTTHD